MYLRVNVYYHEHYNIFLSFIPFFFIICCVFFISYNIKLAKFLLVLIYYILNNKLLNSVYFHFKITAYYFLSLLINVLFSIKINYVYELKAYMLRIYDIFVDTKLVFVINK